MKNKFAERVTELLEEKGITKYKLAKDIGISKSVLCDYCNGKVQPTADVILRSLNILTFRAITY